MSREQGPFCYIGSNINKNPVEAPLKQQDIRKFATKNIWNDNMEKEADESTVSPEVMQLIQRNVRHKEILDEKIQILRNIGEEYKKADAYISEIRNAQSKLCQLQMLISAYMASDEEF